MRNIVRKNIQSTISILDKRLETKEDLDTPRISFCLDLLNEALVWIDKERDNAENVEKGEDVEKDTEKGNPSNMGKYVLVKDLEDLLIWHLRNSKEVREAVYKAYRRAVRDIRKKVVDHLLSFFR